MPKIRPLTREAKLDCKVKDMSDECKVLMMRHDIKQKEVAEFMGLDPSCISHQFRNKNITLRTYAAVQMILDEREAAALKA